MRFDSEPPEDQETNQNFWFYSDVEARRFLHGLHTIKAADQTDWHHLEAANRRLQQVLHCNQGPGRSVWQQPV